MDEMETMQQAVARLTAAGYTEDFAIEDGRISCPACDTTVSPSDVSVDEVVRFEGETNPDDESALYAISSGPCDHRGTLAVAFGPDISGSDADAVRALSLAGRNAGGR
ncbi:MAG: hypothetical protein S0880_28315 [Actinomycetota bacterium]|nr:hypothetical protein [Actinomycetota bacterium]